jgi:hypothetical protein
MLGSGCGRIGCQRHIRGHCRAILRRFRDGGRELRGNRNRILAVADGNSSNCWPFIHGKNWAGPVHSFGRAIVARQVVGGAGGACAPRLIATIDPD